MFNLFKKPPSEKIYTSPGGDVFDLCLDMMKQPHILIAGTSGSGKSAFVIAFLTDLIKTNPPGNADIILIDPKRVDLQQFKDLPHCIKYASEPDEIVNTLIYAIEIMECRYKQMQKEKLKKYNGGEIYIIVEEFADLITNDKKSIQPLICRLAQLGRAARIHLVIATQRATRDIITGQIKVNIDSRIALRVPTAQDSRNIINTNGAETLPKVGRGYYLTADTITPELWEIPYYTEEETEKIIKFYLDQE